jgi:hypothetical protein
MRYCQFNLGSGASQSQSQQQLLQGLSHDAQHLPPALRDKLEAALAGARKEAASSLSAVTWGADTRVPVSSEGVRVALLKLQEAEEAEAAAKGEGEGEGEEEEAAFAAVFGAYGEALECVQRELVGVEGEGSGPRAEALRGELRMLSAFLQHGRLQTTMRRTQVRPVG